MGLQIPTVTVDDLRSFHAKHFPTALLPTTFFHGATEPQPPEETPEDDLDELGYYDDGVKRTLTEEQIAIFRHSEIHAIIRDRRRRRDASEPLDPEPTAEIAGRGTASVPANVLHKDGSNLSKVQQGRIEKQGSQRGMNNWTKTSEKTRQKNHKKSKKNKQRKKEKRRQSREGSPGSPSTDNDESDEWDPWHQATGPDAQKDTNVQLDY